MKKIIIWILTKILWPVLKEILVHFGKLLMKYLLDVFKQLLQKWMVKEQSYAKTDKEKDDIRKKYEERMDDIESIKMNMDTKIDRIVEDALKESEEESKRIVDKSKDIPRIESNIKK